MKKMAFISKCNREGFNKEIIISGNKPKNNLTITNNETALHERLIVSRVILLFQSARIWPNNRVLIF